MKSLFLNLKTRNKLIFVFSMIIFLFLSMVILSSVKMKEIQGNFIFSSEMEAAIININEQRLAMLMLADMPANADRAKFVALMKDKTNKNNKIFTDLISKNRSNQYIVDDLSALNSERENFNQVRDEKIIPMILSGKIDDAKSIIFGSESDFYNNIFNSAQSILDKMHTQTSSIILNSFLIFYTMVAFTVIFSMFIIFVFSRNVSNPLEEMADLSRKISEGDLNISHQSLNREDEIGILSKSFSKMIAYLKDISNLAEKVSLGDLSIKINPLSDQDMLGVALLKMVENLKKLTSDIMSSVDVVNAAIVEISTSAIQLSATSSETATAVSETTGTIEEVRQTAQRSNEKSKTIVENSSKTTQIAKMGKDSTESSILEINKVCDQIKVIAQNMEHLSEQSHLISEILETVDDLAQQSNLLAVNAAIEAAKAGEHGKGFSVVAQEIKVLSEQSKAATGQVRNVLNDIQKATNSAVIATEQGTKVAQVSQNKSSESGEAIQVLTNSVSETSEEMTVIAEMSSQQLNGMEQAVIAMENIREASNKNVESMRQLEQSAQNLKKLSNQMRDFVGKYKLQDESI